MTGLTFFSGEVFEDYVESGFVIYKIHLFLFRREVREQSQAKPNWLRNLLNFKPINPCKQGNLTFLHFYLSKHL